MDDRLFERIVREAVESIPERLRDALDNIAIVIEDRPSRRLLREMGMEPGEPLYGLYEGIPLTEREMGDQLFPDKITIYKGELLRAGFRGRQLVEEIRLTVIHEIGHYFGLDDDAMEEMGY